MNPPGAPHSQQPAAPFGYAFDFNSQDSIQETSDLPGPGPTLLNNSEDDFINSFFIRHGHQNPVSISNNPYQQNMQMQGQTPGNEMQDFEWLLNEQAPTFLGASATPNPPPTPPSLNTFHGLPMNMHTNFDFGQFDQTTDLLASSHQDIISAASILNNTSSSQPQNPRMLSRSMGSVPSILESIEPLHTPSALPTTSYLSQPVSQPAMPYNQHILGLQPLNTVQDLNYTGPQTAPPRMEGQIDERLYRFGSDHHFNEGGFIPQSEAETDKYVSDRLTNELHMLKPINRSNDVTRQSSPARQSGVKRSLGSLGQGTSEDEEGQSSRPLKRRRQDSEDESYGAKAKSSMRKSSHNPRLRRVSSAENGSKRRRSSLTGSATKQSRENLSEEQKRNNHIQSEQKRRNLIKEGFEQLHILVPQLRQGGLSKSMVLNEAGDFLELLMGVNKKARDRLNGHNGG